MSPGVYDFDVKVRSNDTGWDRYADRIEAVGPDGTIFGTQVLEQPHENGQPFVTRLTNVTVPGVVDSVVIRVHFTVSGYDGLSINVRLGAR